jgi:two-component system, NarL family, nitrate/nitrite response regulator NarL
MRPTGSIRITIADDHPIFRLGVRTLLSHQDGFAVVAEAGDSESAVDVVTSLRPDILLIDHNLPRLNGLDVVRRIHAARTGTRAIILTAAMSEPEIQHALLHGAWGVVLKHTATDVLPECIRQVMKGEHWIGVESVNALIGGIRAPTGGGSLSLTPREVDIVRRVARGASNKDIASDLTMGEQTVKNHLRRIFRKLNVANRVELALLAVEQQIGSDAGTSEAETESPTETETEP